MFKQQVVTDCPHTRRAQGVVLMSPELISQLAAAVCDDDEWAIILTGERRRQGYEVEVTGYRLPPQTRGGAEVVIAEFDLEPDDVGVIHCHPGNIGVFFSRTDKTTLNPRFPISIVVGPENKAYLGFAYEGTGKVVLPCGATGEIEFKIQPTCGPIVNEISLVTHKESDLGDCTKVTNNALDHFHVAYSSACGLSEAPALKANAFGQDKTLLDQVDKLARPIVVGLGWGIQGDHKYSSKDFHKSNHKKESKGGYLSSLIPERFKTKPKEPALDEIEGMVLCEVCKTYDEFLEWECGICGRAEYCMACNMGHDTETWPHARIQGM